MNKRPRFAPTRWLMISVAVLWLPLALAEVARPGLGMIGLLLVGVLTLIGVIDALRALNHAGGIQASMRGLTRLSLAREGVIETELRLMDGARPPASLRVGLVAPRQLGLDTMDALVRVPADARAVRVAWCAQPRRRGVYRLERAHLEVRSPFGFWVVRWPVALQGEVRVYPNLMAEGRRLAALFLRRPTIGWRSQRLVGRGRDFEKLRDYLPGDGSDEIHWKATAKRGHPVTKVFQVERTQEIYAIVDASRLSNRNAGAAAREDEAPDDTLLERQVNGALALALAAERQGDLFGLATFADRPRNFVRAKNGPAHFQACREALVRLQPEPVSPDFRDVCTFLRARLSKRALLVFFTSLDDPAMAESFVDAVAVVASRHLVLVAAPLPPDAAPLFTGEPPENLEAAYARLGGHVRWQSLQDLSALLHRHGVRLALLARDELAAGAVSQYMALKQMQVI